MSRFDEMLENVGRLPDLQVISSADLMGKDVGVLVGRDLYVSPAVHTLLGSGDSGVLAQVLDSLEVMVVPVEKSAAAMGVATGG